MANYEFSSISWTRFKIRKWLKLSHRRTSPDGIGAPNGMSGIPEAAEDGTNPIDLFNLKSMSTRGGSRGRRCGAWPQPVTGITLKNIKH